MSQVVLIVEKNDRIRAAIRQQFLARNVPTYDVSDAFDAMSALGRAEFGAIVAAAGKRQLSLRGLCQLARRRHPSVHIFVIVTQKQAPDVEQLESAVGVQGLQMVPPETTTEQLAGRVVEAMRTPFQPRMVESTSPRRSVPTPTGTRQPPRPEVPAEAPVWSTPSGEGPAELDLSPLDVAIDLPADEELGAPSIRPAPAPMGAAPAPLAFDDEILDLDLTATSAPAPTPAAISTEDDFDVDAIDLEPVDCASEDELRLDVEPVESAFEAVDLEPLDSGVVLEGRLDGGVGAALLMSLASQQFTGALAIDSGAALGQLFLYGGDPVWATHPDGDAHLFDQLVRTGHLPPDVQLAPVPAGQLLGHLTQTGQLTGKKIYDFMLGYVRGRVLSLIGQQEGAYRFVEDPAFLEVAPLLKVNPFGLVLESKRRTMTPDRLLTLSSELEWMHLYALPQLGPAVEELKPFTRDLNVAELIGGGRTVRSFCQKTGLDDLMGTLVVLSMVDARLVTLEPEMRENTNVVLSHNTSVRSSRQPSVEGNFDDVTDSQEVKEAQNRLIQLYMQLKPLTQPSQVLGIEESDLTEDQVRLAYEMRMAALDPQFIPEGSAQAILQTQVGELRLKVENAYQALLEQFMGR